MMPAYAVRRAEAGDLRELDLGPVRRRRCTDDAEKCMPAIAGGCDDRRNQ
jgi:hypothetical protein